MVLVDGLADCYLFAGVPDDVVGPVHEIAQVDRFSAGEKIFQENAEATDIYLLKSGQVTLSFTFVNEGRTLHVDIKRVQPGELFGWSALTRARRLSAQAHADADCEVIRIPGIPLRERMERDPRLGYVVMDRLTDLASHRLRDTREQLRVLLAW